MYVLVHEWMQICILCVSLFMCLCLLVPSLWKDVSRTAQTELSIIQSALAYLCVCVFLSCFYKQDVSRTPWKTGLSTPFSTQNKMATELWNYAPFRQLRFVNQCLHITYTMYTCTYTPRSLNKNEHVYVDGDVYVAVCNFNQSQQEIDRSCVYYVCE